MNTSGDFLPQGGNVTAAPGPNVMAGLLRLKRVLLVGGVAMALAACTPGAGAPEQEPGSQVNISASPNAVDTGMSETPETSASEPQPASETERPKTAADRIVQTALAYAWPTEGHGPNPGDAKVQGYMAELYSVLNLPPDNPNVDYDDSPESDCGAFVAFVMHKSGVDPNYPARETNIQITYLEEQSNPYNPAARYQRVDLNNLQPGDILIYNVTYDANGNPTGHIIDGNPADDPKDGHTFIYVGSAGPDGVYGTGDDIDAVGASWFDNVPQRQSLDLSVQTRTGAVVPFSVYRYVGAA